MNLHNTDEINQEDKPRAAIFAEYLAQGYEIGDNVLQKAIEVDRSQGISVRFTNLLNNTLKTLDEKTHASERAQTMDSTYHLSEKAENGRNMLTRYFEKALETAPGQRIRQFYESSEKQVVEIHQEAKRLAEMKKEKKRQSQAFGRNADGRRNL